MAVTRTLVKEKNTERLSYQKLERKASVVGFAESTPTFGDVNEVCWGSQYLLLEVAVT